MNKKMLIGLGVLAVAGIGLYMWNKNKKSEKSDEKSSEENKSSEEKSNAMGTRMYSVKRGVQTVATPLSKENFKTCSCSAVNPTTGKTEVWTKTDCTKSGTCSDCCQQTSATGDAKKTSESF